MPPPFPPLPSRAAYIHLSNPSRRNALSLAVLRSLKSQLLSANTSPATGRILLLPPFRPSILRRFEENDDENLRWLTDADVWRRERSGLSNVLVLRSEGPVFCSGHDLKELRRLSRDEVKETFALCAEVMRLIRSSPAVVVGAVQGLATAAGTQLALSTDLPIALYNNPFQLPGASIGLPCTSPSTAVSRRVPPAQAYRMLALAEPVPAYDLHGAIDLVPEPLIPDRDPPLTAEEILQLRSDAFERRVADIVTKIVTKAGQPAALGKWGFWTQLGIRGTDGVGGDGYIEAAEWAGRLMAVHARSEDAKEGSEAFFGKRNPEWKT